MAKLTLTIVSQEKKLTETIVEQITAPTALGEVTILPGHIPLFSKLNSGELVYVENGTEHTVVISPGFLNVAPDNAVTIMIDSAVFARDISVEKAKQAIQQAKETLATASDRRELILAEASLRRAMLEVKVAEKSRRSRV